MRICLCFLGVVLAFHAVGHAQSVPADPRLGTISPATEPVAGKSSDATVREQLVPGAKASIPVFSLGKDYRVGPNDLIDIEIGELDNFKRTVRVNALGAVSLPLIGPTVIAGLTAQEVEKTIADRYAEKYLQNPQVSIFIREFTTERITVEGAVGKPGIFPLTGQLTLLKVLAMAGGFGAMAKQNEVMLFRVNENGVREKNMFDVDQIRSGKNEDPPVKGDDLIVVQRDSTRVFLKDSLFKDIVDTINPFTYIVPHP